MPTRTATSINMKTSSGVVGSGVADYAGLASHLRVKIGVEGIYALVCIIHLARKETIVESAEVLKKNAVPESLTRLGFKIRRFGSLPEGFDPLTATDRQRVLRHASRLCLTLLR
jgi:hypothetical protein